MRFLGVYGDLAGTRAAHYELDDPPTVARLTELVLARHPRLAAMRGSVRVLVNGRVPAPGDLLREDDRVAVLGAIAGGVSDASP